MTRVLFVCLGNICRSPTAEVTFAALVAAKGAAGRYVIDSAGTAGHHAGEEAHPPTRAEAARRGTPITHRARAVTAADFARFDLLVAMDAANRRDLERLAPTAADRGKIRLFRAYDRTAPREDLDVPDPWYTGEFERVYDLCAAASAGLFEALERGEP